jgi:hypothetical protein
MLRNRARVRRSAPLLAVLVAGVALAGCVTLNRPPPPPGTFQGFGLDACETPSTAQMQAWLGSPYRGVGIYIGGGNRACADQPNLNSTWVSIVANEGWHLTPIYVGLQAPCAGGNVGPTINVYYPGVQGAQSADDAIRQANIYGLGPGTPIYYDMEAYNNSDAFCVLVVRDFVTGWVNELHLHGYVAGYYSSSASGIADQAAIVQDGTFAHPDAIWFANWNNRLSVFGDPFFSDAYWFDHQRLHQFQGCHTECWNGACINIDSSIDDGPLAG